MSTVTTDADSAVITLERFYVSLDALRGFVAPADWQQCARNYYRPTGHAPEGLLSAMIGNALSFAAQGADDLAMASLWQALTMIKDAVAAQQATTVDDMLRLAGLLAPVGWDKPNTSPATEDEARS